MPRNIPRGKSVVIPVKWIVIATILRDASKRELTALLIDHSRPKSVPGLVRSVVDATVITL